MSAITIIRTKLGATSAVTTLVPKASMYPIMWPQAAQPPAIIINLVGDVDVQMLSGAGRYYDSRIRLECIHTSPTETVAIGDAVQAALEDVVKATIGAFTDVDIQYLSRFTDWADDRSMCRDTADYSVRWRS